MLTVSIFFFSVVLSWQSGPGSWWCIFLGKCSSSDVFSFGAVLSVSETLDDRGLRKHMYYIKIVWSGVFSFNRQNDDTSTLYPWWLATRLFIKTEYALDTKIFKIIYLGAQNYAGNITYQMDPAKKTYKKYLVSLPMLSKNCRLNKFLIKFILLCRCWNILVAYELEEFYF